MSIALSARRPARPATRPAARRGAAAAPQPTWDEAVAPYRIEEARWGFRIHAREGEPLLHRVAQALAMTVGAAATAAAVALLWPLATGGAGGTLGLRIGLAALIGGGGLLLLWFASRGTLVEAEVDAARGEVRQRVRNLVGRPTVIARHGFDTVRGVRVVRDFGGRGLAVLSLDLAAGDPVVLAAGAEGALAPLRRRLERELLVTTRAPRPAPAPVDPLAAVELCAA